MSSTTVREIKEITIGWAGSMGARDKECVQNSGGETSGKTATWKTKKEEWRIILKFLIEI
jgi:hypothetical protein